MECSFIFSSFAEEFLSIYLMYIALVQLYMYNRLIARDSQPERMENIKEFLGLRNLVQGAEPEPDNMPSQAFLTVLFAAQHQK